MSLEISSRINSLFEQAITTIGQEIFNSLFSNSQPIFLSIISLYIVFIGYFYIMGYIQQGWQNLVRLILIYPSLITTLFNYDVYFNFVIVPFNELHAGVTQIVANVGNSKNIYSLLDTMIFKVISDVNTHIFEEASVFSLTDLGNVIFGVILIIAYLLMYILAIFLILESKVMVNVFLFIGVIPIFLFTFNATKHYTFTWIKATVTYFLFAPLAALLLLISINVITLALSEATQSITTMIFASISAGIVVLFLKKVPEYANNLTMGMSSGVDASSSMMNWSSMLSQRASSILKRK